MTNYDKKLIKHSPAQPNLAASLSQHITLQRNHHTICYSEHWRSAKTAVRKDVRKKRRSNYITEVDARKLNRVLFFNFLLFCFQTFLIFHVANIFWTNFARCQYFFPLLKRALMSFLGVTSSCACVFFLPAFVRRCARPALAATNEEP